MEEKTIYFKMEMDVNEDYLRETWDVYPKVKRATRLLTILPAVGFLSLGWLWATTGELSMGFLIVALLFLAFDLLMPRLVLRQTLASYRRYQADGPRHISLLDDGVETELVKYGKTLFHAYADFEQVEEDDHGWYLTRPGQRVVIPKGHCTQGDPAEVRQFLEERMAAAKAQPCLSDEAEEDN